MPGWRDGYIPIGLDLRFDPVAGLIVGIEVLDASV
jgi:hypothetical protein